MTVSLESSSESCRVSFVERFPELSMVPDLSSEASSELSWSMEPDLGRAKYSFSIFGRITVLAPGSFAAKFLGRSLELSSEIMELLERFSVDRLEFLERFSVDRLELSLERSL